MKIGTLTFHYGRNYGALLQARGLYRALESLGHDVVTVHYIPKHCSHYMSPQETSWLRAGWRTLGPRRVIERKLRTHRFSQFRKNELRLTQRCHGKDDLVREVATLDVLVVGSDQVWNLSSQESDDLCYFIDFPTQERLRCISYAACCGQKNQSPAYLSEASGLLANFHAIGVRDDVTAAFVRSLAARDSTVVADPTLLVDYSVIEDGYVPEDGYILTYFLEQSSFAAYAMVAGRVKQRLRLPIWSVADGNAQWGDTPFPKADRNWFGVSPGRFLSLIRHAACILTDSFHGTIFSVKYRRPFLTINDGGWRNMRILDLANRYGIGHRITNTCDPIDDALLVHVDDLQPVQKRFDAHKRNSYEFLRIAIAG